MVLCISYLELLILPLSAHHIWELCSIKKYPAQVFTIGERGKLGVFSDVIKDNTDNYDKIEEIYRINALLSIQLGWHAIDYCI
mgnify:CR=1 FL=1|jgi:hypothetical protein